MDDARRLALISLLAAGELWDVLITIGEELIDEYEDSPETPENKRYIAALSRALEDIKKEEGF